ncbi:MAG TPA: hypothetical protein VL523_07435 [Terriglobia bacterium]|nr:hypothetical protein [Terriglobia bacterium]
MTRTLLAAIALSLACALGQAQSAPSPQASSSKSPEAAKPELSDAKPVVSSGSAAPALKGVAVTGSEAAARKAAEHLATQKDAAGSQPAAKAGDQTGKPAPVQRTPGTNSIQDASSAAPTGAVGEFQPAPEGESGEGKPATGAGSHGHPPQSRVHGKVYGAGGGVGRQTGEAVGATSKSGNTSVYVQTDQTKSAANPPQ